MVQLSYITVYYRKTSVEFNMVTKQWEINPQVGKNYDFGLVGPMSYHLSLKVGGNIIHTVKI